MNTPPSPDELNSPALDNAVTHATPRSSHSPSIVRDLAVLVEQQAKFSTVYADPPWPYSNTAARGAAENHYRTMTLADSRKPFLFRGLIEQVSPGPYLELYGREEQPRSQWTVYGNQVERRLF